MIFLYSKFLSHEHAVNVAEEHWGIRHQIAATDPSRLIDVALALAWLAYYQWQVDRRKDALVVSQEMLAIYRDLAERDPSTRRAGLVRALQDTSSYMGQHRRPREALAVIEEAVQLSRQLENDGALARALSWSGWCWCVIGQHKKAIEVASEGIEVTRALIVNEPTTHLPQLASDIQRLSWYWYKRGRSKEALSMLQEAVSIHRTLAQDNSADHLPQLASCLNSIGYHLNNLGRPSEAAVADEECIAIRRNLAAMDPDKYSKALATALVNYAWIMHRLGRHGEAYRVRKEAWILCPETRRTFWGPYALDRTCAFIKSVTSVPVTPSARRRAAKDVMDKVQAHLDEFGDDKAEK